MLPVKMRKREDC